MCPNLDSFPLLRTVRLTKGVWETEIWLNEWLNKQYRHLERETDCLFVISKAFHRLKVQLILLCFLPHRIGQA